MSIDEAGSTRLTGDAAWKAHRDELDKRNAAAKKKAADHKSADSLAAAARERRLAKDESTQLDALNERIAEGRDS